MIYISAIIGCVCFYFVIFGPYPIGHRNFISENMPLRESEIKKEQKKATDKEHRIVLHNDDVNTFDFVIEALIKVCEHDFIQAEQCALITHFKGKCTVLTGELTKLRPKYSNLLELGLSASLH